MRKLTMRVLMILALITAVDVSTFASKKVLPIVKVIPPTINEYDFGYQEGMRYYLANQYGNYITILNSYRLGLQNYPEMADYFNARIQGIQDGWNQHGDPSYLP